MQGCRINVIKYLFFVMTKATFTTRFIPIANRFFKFVKRIYVFNICMKSVPNIVLPNITEFRVWIITSFFLLFILLVTSVYKTFENF